MRIIAAETGMEISPDTLGHTQLGFGQGIHSRTFPIVVRIEAGEFITLMNKTYEEFVAGTRETVSDDSDDLLHLARYPSLAQAMEDVRLLWYVLRECLQFDFLEMVAPSETPQVEIDDILDVSLTDGHVSVTCSAYCPRVFLSPFRTAPQGPRAP